METYLEMMREAEQGGTWTKETMWASVAEVDRLLTELRDTQPDLYWRFLRRAYGAAHGCQYDEAFALHDVAAMRWVDAQGHERTGGRWTAAEVEEATKTMQFPTSVTRWTRFVAFNAMYTDMVGSGLTDDGVISAAYAFYFRDRDWPGATKDGFSASKTWQYMAAKSEMERE
jgi:hypothetical protein